MRGIVTALAVLAMVIGSPARAEWREARTDHFILTIDDTEDGARDFATRLERFDAALRRLYGVADRSDQHARPIAIMAMKPDLYNATCNCLGVLAFYHPGTERSFIMTMHVPQVDRKAKVGGWSSQTLLLHEYSHHFAFSSFPIAYPYWFSEGFAEFNANSSFEADGSIIIGYPANYRAEALQTGKLSMKKLFDPYQFGFGDDIDLVYGRGWLLTHYLVLGSKRKGQLGAYLAAVNKGVPSFDAAQAAFGDLKKLEAELDAYQRGALFAPLRVPSSGPIKVTVRTLSPGQAAMLPSYLLATRGLPKSYSRSVASRAEGVAKKYVGDAVVQSELAEIDYLADRMYAADAAADRALAADSASVSALMRKGLVAVQRAKTGKVTDPAVWTAARAWFLKANRIAPDDAMPFYLYYSSYAAEGAKPTRGAVKGLMRASVIAPESTQIGFALARQLLMDGDAPGARALLQPIAFAPHSALAQNLPLDVVNLIDAGKIDEAKAKLEKDAADARDKDK